MTFFDKIKQKIWHFAYKYFLVVQEDLLKRGIIHHNDKRQPYHLGWLASDKTLEDLKKHLHAKWGFGNHFVAWTDKGQVLSWRKLADFADQYHLRVFKDGEIRGHYELTPEAHPLAHLEGKGEVDKRGDFLKFLGDFVVPKRNPMRLKPDPNAYNPDSEVTINS
ncbi:hypothetical protein A3G06_02045 [Candidatus Nomurabacteria bacterium RIFCSPLOWO2_12_FULL_46_14]|uniref:Uncharacterized protein n=1 Tax=Candidatus Nomurabacteria bacterium RIFCSPLOWO2_12_FULL_46_14 TaxID=1801797 RepID=A0A1F6YDB3_9BACT|nr:MAG: hypothetical protein A3G06_02045 [Candidatus Nomurabacteria bacterium RIFCSPLOWO2_12_FULL_46_14]